MYAVIKSGGKQYRVAAGDKIKVESMRGDVGEQVKLTDVLTVADGDQVRFGAPFLSGAAVLATVLGHGRHEKVAIFKMRRRKHFQKHAGHRQNYTELRIDELVQGSRPASQSGDRS
jgi:large subunit ribosomal protein L21